MENSGSSTKHSKSTDSQSLKYNIRKTKDVTRTELSKSLKFAAMIKDKTTDYTPPVLKKGKAIKVVPKGSTREKEEALQDWYVEYYFTDLSINIIRKRIKVRDNINRIKDPKEKLKEANKLLQSIIELLREGYNPINETSNTKLYNEIVSLSIEEAVKLYLKDLEDGGMRKKSLQTYSSKLMYFVKFYAELKVNAVDSLKVDDFLKSMRSLHKWAAPTFNAARQTIHGLMRYLVKQKYITVNPVIDVDRQKKVEQPSSHKPISDADLKTIINYLNEHDQFTSLFVKTLYYTCIRPKELRGLKLNMIDLETNRITIPGTLAKNKRTAAITIDISLQQEFRKLNIEEYKSDWFLFGSSAQIISDRPTGENTPYNRFMSCLINLGLQNKGYTLYCIKHTSNIRRYLDGNWSIAELMVANRHSSITQTESYLRDLNLRVNLEAKAVPPI